MNKIKFSIFAIILACIFVFAGCTKASNATLEQCYALFDSTVAQYETNQTTGKIKVFDDNMHVDLYSSNSYSNSLYNHIAFVAEEGSNSILNTLKIDAEYQVLIHGVSQLFLEWRVTNPLGEIPQEKISKLYEALNGLENVVKNVSRAKSSLETTFDFTQNDNSTALKSSLNEFLEMYCNLINKFYDISVAYEGVYEALYMPNNNQEVIMLNDMDLKKLVLSSEVYFAKYYYLKNIKLSKNYTSRFGFEKIYNGTNFVENENFDELFANFVAITKNDASISAFVIQDPNDQEQVQKYNDYIMYYNAGVKKLQSIKNGIVNYEKAVDIILKNQDTTGEYQKFVDNFATEIQNFQNYITANIMN